MKKLLKEPLVHFLIIGALMFVISDIIEKDYVSEDYRIEITKQNVESMFKRWVEQLKRMPTQEEFDAYLENYLKEEILYREAKTMGLDKDDIIIKRRLVQKLEFLTNDLINISPPNLEEVKKYYEENPDEFTLPGKVDFIHIFFSIDASSLDEVKEKAEVIKKNLNQKSEIPKNYFKLGDPFLLPYEFNDMPMDNVTRNFGQSEFSDNLYNLSVGKWDGPFLSTYGVHLVYVLKKQLSTMLDFIEVKENIKLEIAEKRNRKAYKDFLSELKKKYNIRYSDELKTFADTLNFPLKEL
jgi:hypothetical protein